MGTTVANERARPSARWSRSSRSRRSASTDQKLQRACEVTEMSSLSSADLAAYVMEKHGLNQKELAAVLGVGQSFISRVARGERNFTFAHANALAAHLGVPVAVLIWRTLGPADGDPRFQEAREIIDELVMAESPEHVKK